MTFRAAGSFGWFAWEVVVIIINYFFTAALRPEGNPPAGARRVVEPRVPPASENFQLLRRCLRDRSRKAVCSFSNHLSYLDVLAISSRHAGGVCVQGGGAALAAVRLAGGPGRNRFRRARTPHARRRSEPRNRNRAGRRRAGGDVSRRHQFQRRNHPAVPHLAAGTGRARRTRNFHRLDSLRTGRRRRQQRKFVIGATTRLFRTWSTCSGKNPSAPRCASENFSAPPTTARNWRNNCTPPFRN